VLSGTVLTVDDARHCAEAHLGGEGGSSRRVALAQLPA
jgi:hypothetical protein